MKLGYYVVSVGRFEILFWTFGPWAKSEKSSQTLVSSVSEALCFDTWNGKRRSRGTNFLGSTKKKVGQVVKMRWSFVVFDRSSSHRKRQGQPWSAPVWRLFPGNIHAFPMAILYATIAIARARDYKSIDRYRRRRLSTQSFMLGSPRFFLAGRLDGKKTWLECVQFRKSYVIARILFLFPKILLVETTSGAHLRRGTRLQLLRLFVHHLSETT